ncbi:hypothetical protein Ancab_002268 [Ancistrocladus abbreviatus]
MAPKKMTRRGKVLASRPPPSPTPSDSATPPSSPLIRKSSRATQAQPSSPPPQQPPQLPPPQPQPQPPTSNHSQSFYTPSATAAAAPPPPPAGNDALIRAHYRPFMRDDYAMEKFMSNFGVKKVLLGLVVDYAHGLDSQSDLKVIREILQFQGWNMILTERLPVYEDLVKFFYANMRIVKPYRELETLVKGKTIRLTPETIASALGISHDGIHNPDQKKWPDSAPFTYDYAMNKIFGTRVAEAMRTLSTTCLSLPHRLLHVIVTHFIEPREGGPLLSEKHFQATGLWDSYHPDFDGSWRRFDRGDIEEFIGIRDIGISHGYGKVGIGSYGWCLAPSRRRCVTAGIEGQPADVEETSVGPTPSAQPSRRGRRGTSAYTQGEGPSTAPWAAFEARIEARFDDLDRRLA